MQIFWALCQLVNYVPNVNILEDALSYHVMQIRLHKFKQKVHIFIVFSFDCFVHFYDVRVLKLPQDLDLTIGTLSICCVLERVKYFFEGECFFAMTVLHLPHVPVGTRTHLLQDVETTVDVLL